jgi:DNA-binding IclR family transcriptional regulator
MSFPQVLIVPANPRDITPEQLEPLVRELAEDTGLTVDLGIVQQRG